MAYPRDCSVYGFCLTYGQFPRHAVRLPTTYRLSSSLHSSNWLHRVLPLCPANLPPPRGGGLEGVYHCVNPRLLKEKHILWQRHLVPLHGDMNSSSKIKKNTFKPTWFGGTPTLTTNTHNLQGPGGLAMADDNARSDSSVVDRWTVTVSNPFLRIFKAEHLSGPRKGNC